MDMIERHEYFKQGIIKRGCDEWEQRLFKTKLSTEQLRLLSERTRKIKIITWVFAWVFFFIGTLYGALLMWSIIT